MSDVVKNRKQRRGRPLVYKDEAERRAARALAARKRRAAMKEQGLKEIRRVVKNKEETKPSSPIIDLSKLYNNKRA